MPRFPTRLIDVDGSERHVRPVCAPISADLWQSLTHDCLRLVASDETQADEHLPGSVPRVKWAYHENFEVRTPEQAP